MANVKSLLTESQIRQWRDQGAVVIELPERIWRDACDVVHKLYPQDRPRDWKDDFGSPNGMLEFPSPKILKRFGDVVEHKEIDDLALNEELIKIAQVLLKTEDIRLTQADAWCKYGSGQVANKLGNKDQRIHMDYGNHTFLHPATWYEPEVLSAILYYDDSSICSGGTAYVTRGSGDDEAYQEPYIKMPGQAGLPFFNQKPVAEGWLKDNRPELHSFRQRLYEREEKVKFKPGSLLLYRHDLWHRGTEVNQGTSRRVHNLVWARQDCPWVHNWGRGITTWNYYGKVEDIITRSTPLQRSVIGFPKPSHPIWKDKNRIENVKARYPGIDMTPYGK